MSDSEQRLIETLVTIQRARRLSDTEMAALLGVKRAQWGHIRTFRRGFGPRSLGSIIANFQDLKEVAVDLLTQRATKVSIPSPQVPAA